MEKREEIKRDVLAALKCGSICTDREMAPEELEEQILNSKFALALSNASITEIDQFLDVLHGVQEQGSSISIKRAAHKITLGCEVATELLITLLHAYPENVWHGIMEKVNRRVTMGCSLMNDPDILKACNAKCS